MVGKELVPKKGSPVDLREVAAQTTLREVRLKGHTYVELRRVGKRVIFFCTICLTPCYSDTVLFDHLKGSLHARRYAAAKVTLFGPVPWPFNDGVLFFNNSREKDLLLLDASSQEKALVVRQETALIENEVSSRLIEDSNSQNGTVVASNGSKAIGNGNGASYNDTGHGKLVAVNDQKSSWRARDVTQNKNADAALLSCNGEDGCLMIPNVLLKEVISSLRVQILGIGNIAYKISETNEAHGKISKIWCAWLGKEGYDGIDEQVSHQCDFAIVNFSYSYDLGRKWGDQEAPMSPSSFFIIDDMGYRGKKRKKSFSDQESSSEELNDHCNSLVEDGPAPGGCPADASRQLQVQLLSSKSVRRELRKQKRLAAERACDICGQPMLLGKDVATLLNCKTGNVVCSSRNANGAFHLFHASCLIHWILLLEYEILVSQLNSTKGTRGRKGRATQKNVISSVLCPECQGTGILVEGDEFEKPTIPVSEMFLYKMKAIEAHKAWMKNPEVLQQCSTGLYFPSETVENSQEKVMLLKLLHFYRADKWSMQCT